MLCESIGLHNTYALATLFIMTYYCNNTVTRNILRSVLEGTIMTLVGERRQRERERESHGSHNHEAHAVHGWPRHCVGLRP